MGRGDGVVSAVGVVEQLEFDDNMGECPTIVGGDDIVSGVGVCCRVRE